MSYKNKGFTLIEVMVVLSILAIIAILAYNFFGGTMKDAVTTQQATKIYNDLRTLEYANANYNRLNGVDVVTTSPSSTSVTDATLSGKLLGDGGLKALPNPVQTGSAAFSFDMGNYDVIGSPTTANDDVIFFDHPTQDVCLAYNKKYSSLGETLWNWDTDGSAYTKLPAGPTACIDALGTGTDPTRFSIIYVVNVR